jgi:hypothetical protein
MVNGVQYVKEEVLILQLKLYVLLSNTKMVLLKIKLMDLNNKTFAKVTKEQIFAAYWDNQFITNH